MKRKSSVVALMLLCCIYVAAEDDRLPEPTQRPDANYRIFRTKNIFTLLKLDTRVGRVWQVQWSTGEERITAVVNDENLVPRGAPPKPGRFTLEPTDNIFTFLLLDQEDGRVCSYSGIGTALKADLF